MGTCDGPHPEDGEGPTRRVALDAYEIATTAVSNAEFGEFVLATGYTTEAERCGRSQVFQGQLSRPEVHDVASPLAPWWRWVEGANWRRPDGTHECMDELPVVHVSLADARAYCAWRGFRLPTEAEWECSASDQSGITPHVWRGSFPDAPYEAPGPRPVAAAEPNCFGLRHACGNVWEWTADRFTRLHSPRPERNPTGPLNGAEFVVKGGSFLCSPSYCSRFRPSSRRGEMPQATTSHLGFRVART